MPSTTSIINSALVLLGEPVVADISQAPKDVQAMYEVEREAELRAANWNFAIQRAQLAADPTPPPFGFRNRFRLPNDSLRLVGLYDERFPRSMTASDTPHRVEGPWLMLSDDVAQVFYVRNVVDASQFDPLFAEALAARIAKKAAFKRTASADLMEAIDGAYERAMKAARFANAIENNGEQYITDTYIESRYTGRGDWLRAFPGGYS